MKKKTIFALGTVIVAVAAYGTAAWQAGKKTEQTLQARVQTLNGALEKYLPFGIKATLENHERGLFSSTSQLKISTDNPTQEPQELLFLLQADHGPLPWRQLKEQHFQPAQSYTTARLQQTPLTEALFKATNGQSPFDIQLTTLYSGQQEMVLNAIPVSFDKDNFFFDYSGLILTASSDEALDNIRVTGDIAHISAGEGTLQNKTEHAEFTGIHFNETFQRKAEQGYELQREHSMEKIQFHLLPAHIVLDQTKSTDTLSDDGKNIAVSNTTSANNLSINQYDLGSINYAVSLDKISSSAAHLMFNSLLGMFKQELNKAKEGAAPSFNSMNSMSLGLAALGLFNNEPLISYGPIKWSLPEGSSDVTFKVGLNRPNFILMSRQPEEMLWDMIRSLDIRLSVSKKMLAKTITTIRELERAFNPNEASLESLPEDPMPMIQGYADALAEAGLLTQEGDLINGSLQVDGGKNIKTASHISFNGVSMTPEEFMSTITERFRKMDELAKSLPW